MWLHMAAQGKPPPVAEVAQLQYGMESPHFLREHFYPILTSMRVGAKHKNFYCREMSRGHGKTRLVHLLILYAAEYIIPFLPVGEENKSIIVVGRDMKHLVRSLMRNLHKTIAASSPWLKTSNWQQFHEGGGGAAAIFNHAPKNFNRTEFCLTNGVTIQGLTINMGVRGDHQYLIVIDDLIDEKTWTKSHEYYELINEAYRPAVEFGGTLLVDGTPRADGDLYDLLSQDERWDYVSLPAISPSYRALNELAIDRGWLPASSITCEDDWNCLWPWRMNHAQLMAERGNNPQTHLSFEREYMLERVADDDSFVEQRHLFAAKDPSLHYSNHALVGEGPYYGGVDPSSLSKDDAAICIGFVDEQNNRIPRHFNMVRARGKAANDAMEQHTGVTPEEIVVKELNISSLAFNNPPIKLEKNAYQGVIKPFGKIANPTLALSKIHVGANKHTESGWLAVRTVFRSRLVRLPYGPTPTEAAQIEAGLLDPSQIEARRITDEFIQQVRNLRVVEGKIINVKPSIHDDMVSAFFLFLKAAEAASAGNTSTATTADIPSASATSPTPAKARRPHDPELDGPRLSRNQSSLNNALRIAASRRRH